MGARAAMRLRVLTPIETVVDAQATKIVAEAVNGAFALLPRHADFAAPLAPGVLTYVDDNGTERFLGVDEGFLVKCDFDVRVSTRRAARSEGLDALRRRIRDEFETYTEQERAARAALARLESDLVRRFVELERPE